MLQWYLVTYDFARRNLQVVRMRKNDCRVARTTSAKMVITRIAHECRCTFFWIKDQIVIIISELILFLSRSVLRGTTMPRRLFLRKNLRPMANMGNLYNYTFCTLICEINKVQHQSSIIYWESMTTNEGRGWMGSDRNQFSQFLWDFPVGGAQKYTPCDVNTRMWYTCSLSNRVGVQGLDSSRKLSLPVTSFAMASIRWDRNQLAWSLSSRDIPGLRGVVRLWQSLRPSTDQVRSREYP
jgi:hypothetical protein